MTYFIIQAIFRNIMRPTVTIFTYKEKREAIEHNGRRPFCYQRHTSLLAKDYMFHFTKTKIKIHFSKTIYF